jgi:hypothetical protein
MRKFSYWLLSLVLVACAGENSGSSQGGPAPLTYDQAVRQIGRPPTGASRSADGSQTAIWETEVKGGKRRLIMKFDRAGNLVESNTETVPSGR